jgi:hypothetical protein
VSWRWGFLVDEDRIVVVSRVVDEERGLVWVVELVGIRRGRWELWLRLMEDGFGSATGLRLLGGLRVSLIRAWLRDPPIPSAASSLFSSLWGPISSVGDHEQFFEGCWSSSSSSSSIRRRFFGWRLQGEEFLLEEV